MPTEKKFKQKIRARQAATGESYSTARKNLETKAPVARVDGAKPPPSAIPEHVRRRADLRLECLGAWTRLTTFLGDARPKTEWRNRDAIVEILNAIGARAPLNHAFYPRGGGNDLERAEVARENGCIALRLDSIWSLFRPRVLELNLFEQDPLREWAYFRLELAPLEPSGVYEELSLPFEELLEHAPGRYVDRACRDEGSLGDDEEGRPIPIPRGARVVTRFFGGSFVIFPKLSAYNAISSTYDGRHNDQSSDEFRAYIARGIDDLIAEGEYGRDLDTGGITTVAELEAEKMSDDSSGKMAGDGGTVSSKSRLPDLDADDLRAMLAACDDTEGHHILYVTKDGHVHITTDLRRPDDWDDDPKIRFRYETYDAGNGYVGRRAAGDGSWVRKLASELARDWKERKTGYVDY